MIYRLIDRIVRNLLRRSLRQGVVEGSIPWLAAGAVALLVRLMFKPEVAKVQREKVALGETLVIRHVPPPESARRKKRQSAS